MAKRKKLLILDYFEGQDLKKHGYTIVRRNGFDVYVSWDEKTETYNTLVASPYYGVAITRKEYVQK